jgi:hypothetical protein
MTIQYSDGRSAEAVLLSRTETTIRVAVQGTEDVLELSEINGTWVSADSEPVAIEFAWQRRKQEPAISEADCCCSGELAERLIQSLSTDSSEDRMQGDAAVKSRPIIAGATSGSDL